MSNLHIILNPESENTAMNMSRSALFFSHQPVLPRGPPSLMNPFLSSRQEPEIPSFMDVESPPPQSAQDDSPQKPKQPKSARYIQEYNKHEPHPDCPDTLACLPDTDGRPQHTLPVILRCAILGSPRRRLTIREIYAAMEDKYSYYKTAGPTWKVTRIFYFHASFFSSEPCFLTIAIR